MRRYPILLSALLVVLPFASTGETPPPLHPHFTKEVVVSLPGGMKLTASHITVPFNADKAKGMKPDQAWHLGFAHLEISNDAKIGGQDIEAGKYSLKARKTEKGWELVLDAPGRSGKISEAGVDLETTFDGKSPLYEHLSIDIQPSGDKSSTKLYLDVRFGKQLARTEIVLPESGGR